MANRNRDYERGRSWRDRSERDWDDDEIMNERTIGWSRDQDRDTSRDWNRDFERQRDWDSIQQWRSEHDYDEIDDDQYINRGYGSNRDFDRDYDQSPRGMRSSRDTFRSRYSQNYPRRGDRERQSRSFNRETGDFDWRSGESFEDDDFNYDRQYNRQMNRQDREEEWDREADPFGEAYWNRPYRREGFNRPRGRNYGLGQGEWTRDSRGLARRRQSGSAGMRSDFEGETGRYRTGGMRSDYGTEYDYTNRGYEDYEYGGVGYEPEGAFYQDLDEPYTYDYWESWNVPGEYTGIGPSTYHRSDERILEDISERLTQHGQIDASNIEIAVNHGEITLKGTVPSRHMKRMAEDTIEDISGVNDITNMIKVQAGAVSQPQIEQTGRMQSGRQRQTGGRRADRSKIEDAKSSGISDPSEKRVNLRKGMEVIGKNGKIIGYVKEIRAADFLVDREMARDVFVPFDALTNVSERAEISVSTDEIDNQNWEMSDMM